MAEKKLHRGEIFYLRQALEQIENWKQIFAARLKEVLADHGFSPDEVSIDLDRGMIVPRATRDEETKDKEAKERKTKEHVEQS